MAQRQSEYMQKRERIVDFLGGLKEKYNTAEAAKKAGTPPALTLEEVASDAHLLAQIEDVVENPYLLAEIREYTGMVARCRTLLGGTEDTAKKERDSGKEPDQLFRKKSIFDELEGIVGKSEASHSAASAADADDADSADAAPGNVIHFSAYRSGSPRRTSQRQGMPPGMPPVPVNGDGGEGTDKGEFSPVYSPIPPLSPSGLPAAALATPAASASSSSSAQLRVRRLGSREAQDEMREIKKMDDDFTRALEDILAHRYEETLAFGATFDCTALAAYLKRIAGEELYLDPLFSMTQQYALADAPIVNEQNHQINRTGFHLALIGDPGTGKTFAIKELIVGNEKEQKPAHGLVGRNKVLGTVSAAAFVRFAEAYEGTKINFVVPELGSWLGYTGVFDLLKRIMEDGVAEHRVKNEHVGPYRFDSFFSVNYNPEMKNGAMALPTNDPNFRAVIDRMVNHAQWQTESRYDAVAENQMRVWEGTTSMDLSQRIQDHVMLVYAAQTCHPSVVGILPQKPVTATSAFFNALRNAREVICEQLRNYSQQETDGSVRVPFSARLEKTTMKIAGAMSMMEYFKPSEYAQQDGIIGDRGDGMDDGMGVGIHRVVAAATPSIEISKQATDYALYSMIQQAALRSNGTIDAKYTCAQLGFDK